MVGAERHILPAVYASLRLGWVNFCRSHFHIILCDGIDIFVSVVVLEIAVLWESLDEELSSTSPKEEPLDHLQMRVSFEADHNQAKELLCKLV